MDVNPGRGPAIKMRDSNLVADPRIKDLLALRAGEVGLPAKLEVLDGCAADASAMQIACGGVLAGCVSIPVRDSHSPSEMIDFRDVQGSVKLLLELLQKPIEI